ncbi:hypothetical protein C8R41DRAFT_809132 [Lentinula lateritia]|uniref:Uncharacterized protein n=1 Tax=Lentinula lateritia TaxID=40482 RepID=A0ABQ8VWV5_9AGAR|nr:hypothetical protein C8R41DRAFT_809132 [Lentinula lateritia]
MDWKNLTGLLDAPSRDKEQEFPNNLDDIYPEQWIENDGDIALLQELARIQVGPSLCEQVSKKGSPGGIPLAA